MKQILYLCKVKTLLFYFPDQLDHKIQNKLASRNLCDTTLKKLVSERSIFNFVATNRYNGYVVNT